MRRLLVPALYLLRHISAQAMSFVALLLPFGALAFGAALYAEDLSARAVGGAALVSAGLLLAQAARRVTPSRVNAR